MELATQTLEIFGLLAVLASIAVVFVQVMNWLLGRSTNLIRSAAVIALSLAVAYLAIEHAFRFLGLADYTAFVSDGVALLWWLSLAFIFDNAIRKFIWLGMMADHGVSHIPKLVRDLFSLLTYAAAIMIVMHFVYDEPIGAVLATSGGVAFVIGLAAQKTLHEAFAGLSLSLSKTLRVGDYLEVNGVYGQVHEMNWRSVSLHNPHTDSLYIFPNSEMASATVLNYCLPTDRFKNWVTFTVEAHASPDLVISAILDELRNSRFVFQDPKPDINLLGFDEWGINYRIRYFFEGDDPWWDAQNEVVNAIWVAMRRHGFHLGINRQKLNTGFEWETPVEPTYIPAGVAEVGALLSSNPLMRPYKEYIQTIASKAIALEWTPPQTIYEQGEQAGAVYLISKGKLNHYLEKAGVAYKVAESLPGELVGFSANATYQTTVQPNQFSRGYLIDLADLASVLPPDALAVLTQSAADESLQRFESSYSDQVAKERDRLHAEGHNRLTQMLKHSLTHYYRGDLLNKVVGSVFERAHEGRLAEVMAGASSLLVVAGEPDNRERERALFSEVVEHIQQLHHVSHEKVMQIYDRAITQAELNFEQARRDVDAEIQSLQNRSDLGHLLMAVCHIVAGASGVPADRQTELLSEFAKDLGSELEHDGMIEALQAELRKPKY